MLGCIICPFCFLWQLIFCTASALLAVGTNVSSHFPFFSLFSCSTNPAFSYSTSPDSGDLRLFLYQKFYHLLFSLHLSTWASLFQLFIPYNCQGTSTTAQLRPLRITPTFFPISNLLFSNHKFHKGDWMMRAETTSVAFKYKIKMPPYGTISSKWSKMCQGNAFAFPEYATNDADIPFLCWQCLCWVVTHRKSWRQ